MRENARAYEAHRNFMCTTIPSAQWGKRLYGVAINLMETRIIWLDSLVAVQLKKSDKSG